MKIEFCIYPPSIGWQFLLAKNSRLPLKKIQQKDIAIIYDASIPCLSIDSFLSIGCYVLQPYLFYFQGIVDTASQQMEKSNGLSLQLNFDSCLHCLLLSDFYLWQIINTKIWYVQKESYENLGNQWCQSKSKNDGIND